MGRFIKQGATTLINLESGIESIRNNAAEDQHDGISSPQNGMGWEQPREEILVPLRSTDGVMLGYSRGLSDMFTMRDVRIFGLGKSYKAAKAHRQEILDALDLARLHNLTGAGDPVYYEHGIGDDDDPDIFRLVTGKWSEPSGAELSTGVIKGELTLTCTRE